jgi:hypothetical protein
MGRRGWLTVLAGLAFIMALMFASGMFMHGD